MRFRAFVCLFVVFCSIAPARQEFAVCGTRPGGWREERFLHRQSLRKRAFRRSNTAPQGTMAPASGRDAGNIAIIEDSEGVVARRNEFDLDRRTINFYPGGGGAVYGWLPGEYSYDAAAASSGTALSGLADDDSRLVPLPFDFPFYGHVYREVYVNSDGNLTFTAPDDASSDRSLGRMTAGPPRIAPLFDDLDPSAAPDSVRVLAEDGRLTVSWVQTPEWTDSSAGPRQTFQVRLYPTGGIEFAYNGVSAADAVSGIAPGHVAGSPGLVSFATDTYAEYSGALVERFGADLAVDITTAAQRFFQTHEDGYDYLVIFNNMGISARSGAVAYEVTVRNGATGFGDTPVDVGNEYGSGERLKAVLNLGPLSQYPTDPASIVSLRGPANDTPVTVIAHEAGHLFLAYATVPDPNDPKALPMLGYQGAHWYFAFNSDASLLEGNRLSDGGPAASPRFTTIGVTEHYSPLDQYLMGFRSRDEVEPEQPLFYVDGAPASFRIRHQQKGVSFDGTRRDVHMDELVNVLGRRTPDYTVAQRRFRFGFVLVVAQGTQPSAEELAKLESFRAAFEQFYEKAASGRATADASLKLNLRLSVSPAAGVATGATSQAEVSVDTPPDAPLAVELRTQTGSAGVPGSVTIPAGASSASFAIAGIRAGVEELSAIPADGRYMTAAARVQVSDPASLRIDAVSGDATHGPVVVRVTDVNELPYAGVRVVATADDGSLDPVAAVTDAQGRAVLQLSSAAGLRVSLDNAPGVSITLHSDGPVR